MRIVLILFFFIQNFYGFGQGSPLYGSDFYRLNETDIRVKSYFAGNGNGCFQTQYRFESISNDSLFFKILFDVRTPATALQCSRNDTVSTAQITDAFSFINVSTGVIRFGEFETSPADTIWNVSDSTFNAQLGIPDFGSSSGLSWNISNNELTVFSDAQLQSLELVDLNGKTMLYTKEDHFDISFLESGVYLMRVLTGSGIYKTIRWFRP